MPLSAATAAKKEKTNGLREVMVSESPTYLLFERP